MWRGSGLLLLGTVMVAGCEQSTVQPGDCVANILEAPAWKNASTDTTTIRVLTTNDLELELTTRLQEYLNQVNSELAAPSRDRAVGLIVGNARVDAWVEPATCKTWQNAVVSKETIANEVVFLQLNEQFARDIVRFRELGADTRRSDEQRSGYLTTALLLLESVDPRYLSRNLAVNYERELIQSRLNEISETSSVDFLALLEQGLKSTSVKAAQRTRLSLQKFESIDPTLASDGLNSMDRLIARLRSQTLRVEIDAIGVRGLGGDYAQAETAVQALAEYTDGREADRANSLIAELGERARTLRTDEIAVGFNELPEPIGDRAVLEDLGVHIAALEAIHGATAEQAEWKRRLVDLLEQVEQMETFSATTDCAAMATLDSFTRFQFGDTDFGFDNRKTRRLVVETTSSEITVANQANASITILSVSQQVTGEDGSVIANGTLDESAQIAANESFTTSMDLTFDNEHPAAKVCMEPLARRTHECWVYVVTSVEVERLHSCPQAAVSYTERVRFESQHLPDNYTIKLWRPDLRKPKET